MQMPPTPAATFDDLLTELQTLPMFSSFGHEQLRCLHGAEIIVAAAGESLLQQGEVSSHFWILLSGEARIDYDFNDVSSTAPAPQYTHVRGSTFGELSLLASLPNPVSIVAVGSTRLVRLDENAFWQMMSLCPEVRRIILDNMAMRFRKMQSMTIQQEKMASLGTLAAGLMHELNNPGAAVKRAAAQLRETFLASQQLSIAVCSRALSAGQRTCLHDLKGHALEQVPSAQVDPLDQSDAEEAMSRWLESAGVPDAWRLAPTLAAVGLTTSDLDCARHSFSPEEFHQSIAWVESFTAGMKLVSVIEEGIGRVSDLVQAVKSYAYEGRGQVRSINVNQSIAATMLILGHKIREKNVTLTKSLETSLPLLQSSAAGLNQVWTNLLDNAIDAVGPGGHVRIETWSAACPLKQECVWIRISDDGAGISQECQAHIFDPFFTTKPAGVGTGLGLGIASRVVEQSGGTMRFTSEPGRTEFLVQLPVAAH